MSLRLLALVAMLLAVTALSSAPLPFYRDRTEEDLKAMQGEWESVKVSTWGYVRNVLQRMEFGDYTLKVEGRRMKFYQLGHPNRDRVFRLDGSKRPGWIDLATWKEGMGTDRAKWPSEGIYKVEGDTLTFADARAGQRPKRFAADSKGEWVWVFKRVKPRP